jgi:AcrR family transcriptional regulator
MDRRVARTRRALQHAFMNFYLHYDSKDELKRAGLEHLRRELVDASAQAQMSGEGAGGALAFSGAFFNHAYRHVSVYRAMVGSGGGAVALSTIRGILIDLVRADPYLPTAIRSDRIAISIVVGALMEVLTGWLDSGAETEPAEIDAAFRRLVLKGIAATVRGG